MSDIDSLSHAFSNFSTYRMCPNAAMEMMERAQSESLVPYSEQVGGFHILSSYEHVRKALLDWRGFVSAPASLRPYVEGQPKLPPSAFDPPEHTHWRKIFVDGVNTRTPERIGSHVRRDVIACIERMVQSGQCDFVSEFAEQIPMLAISHILGLDASTHATLRDLTQRLLGNIANPAEFKAVYDDFIAFGCAQVETRRINRTDDYLSVLADAQWDGRPLTPDETGRAFVGLVLGGHHTTVVSITSLFYEVLSDPALKANLIANPDLIPAAVEESLRLHSPLFGRFRSAGGDLEMGGSRIAAGESVYICIHAANRDPRIFPDPTAFRLDREQMNHFTFGLGKHSCVGAATARMEMIVALEEVLARAPDMEIADRVRFEFAGAETIFIRELPVRIGRP